MATVNVKAMDLEALLALRAEVDAEIKEKQIEARRSFIDEMRQAAAKRGLDLSEFVDIKRGARRSGSGSRSPAAVKYRDADSGQTWSGRGRLPKWLTEMEEQGRNRDEFLVADAATGDGDDKGKGKRKKAAAAE